MSRQNTRVLILGRSAPVLLDSLTMLRGLGYAANASNRFDSVLDDYDFREIDLVVLGGMVPPAKKTLLRETVSRFAPRVAFLQGLGGIPRLLVAQVEEHFRGPVDDIGYDSMTRTLRLTLPAEAAVAVQALWAEIVPPDPIPRSRDLLQATLAPGVHDIVIPADVPVEGSFLTAAVGTRVSALPLGPAPAIIARLSASGTLPPPAPVHTLQPWD